MEGQQTFCKPPALKAARGWRERAPQGFEFALKAWQPIAHPPSSLTYRQAGLKLDETEKYSFFKPTPQVWQAGEETRGIAWALGARVVVFQCPPSFSPGEENRANLREFFRRVEREFLLAGEPRGEWPGEVVRGLCQELGLIHCVDPFLQTPLWGEVNYFRLHGGLGYRHQYTEEELGMAPGDGEGRNESYVLFNNLSMHDDAQRFLQLLGR